MAEQQQPKITEDMVRGWLKKAKAPEPKPWNSAHIGMTVRNAQAILERMQYLAPKPRRNEQPAIMQAQKAVAVLQAALADLEPGLTADIQDMTSKKFDARILKPWQDRVQEVQKMQAALANFWIATDEADETTNENHKALETLYECYCWIVPNSFIGTDPDNPANAFLTAAAPALGIKGGTGNRNLVLILPKKGEMQRRVGLPNYLPWSCLIDWTKERPVPMLSRQASWIYVSHGQRICLDNS